MTAQTNAAHHVRLKEAEPVVIANLLEGPRLEDTHIIDEDLYFGTVVYQPICPFRRGEVRCYAFDFALRVLGLDSLLCLAHPQLALAIHNHLSALPRQCGGD